MAIETTIPPSHRSNLVLQPMGADGGYVVKDKESNDYYQLGPHEGYLLSQLDGAKSVADICGGFEKTFGETFTPDDLDEFLELAKKQGFLQLPPTPARSTDAAAEIADSPTKDQDDTPAAATAGQSIFFWRKSLFDPDRLLTWMVPKLRFLWTKAFVIVSLCFVAGAFAISWTSRVELMAHLPTSVRWETLALAWCSLIFITLCHEFAHGLTCKRFGGSVHEIGFLLLIFLPCFYCNVSDAWLIREKSKRMWITLAGAYCDLCFWALATYVWWASQPGTIVQYLAWVVFTVCGIRVFLNFNPLIKLDGYYLFSDWMGVYNLRKRSWNYTSACLRSFLWGADKPTPEPRGRVLVGYGIASWLFMFTYMSFMFVALYHWLGSSWGAAGLIIVSLFGLLILFSLLNGIGIGEIVKMFRFRYKRSAVWLGIFGVLAALFLFVPVRDNAGGQFQIHSENKRELRAPLSGFLRLIDVREGDDVSKGAVVARMEIPDLSSRLAQKQAAIHEAEAQLKLLKIGSRKEEIVDQKERVSRLKEWCDLARVELDKKQKSYTQKLTSLTEKIEQAKVEVIFHEDEINRAKGLLTQQAFSLKRYREIEKQLAVSKTQFAQAQAQHRAHLALGNLDAEAELARRVKELADAKAKMTLLLAGTRPEKIAAQEAILARLSEEMRYLEETQQKLEITAPITGRIATPRLRNKLGHYLKEGDLICEIIDPDSLEVEIIVEEQEAGRIQVGQEVALKVRALPFTAFQTKVDRVGSVALKGEKEIQSKIHLRCSLLNRDAKLLPGMTGYASIRCGTQSIGSYAVSRVYRYLRTEVWW